MDLKELKLESEDCLKFWRDYEKNLVGAGLNGPLKATAIGWKVADLKAFKDITSYLMSISEQIHVGTVNGRFIGSFILKKPITKDKIKIIKILQRRPGSKDPLGLDHIDFYEPDIKLARQVFKKTDAHWQDEKNDVHNWISLRFGRELEYEAKFVDHIVLDAAIKEMQLAKDLI